MRRTCVLSNITSSTKLRGAQHSLELAFRSTDFRVPENLIFPALFHIVCVSFARRFFTFLNPLCM